MNRRGFLSFFAAAAATATLDPEQLLWKPGKLVSIPAPKIVKFTFGVGDVFTMDGVYRQNPRFPKETGVLQQFVVVQGGVAGDISLMPFFPPIIERGQYQNVRVDKAVKRVGRPFKMGRNCS